MSVGAPWTTSCYKQCTQDFKDFFTWLAIPGNQKHSCSRDKVWSHPWWPVPQWHPFKVATQCSLGTMKSRRSSVLPLGIKHRYKAPWWITKFCQLHKIRLPSSLEVCYVRSTFKSVLLCASSQSSTVINIWSSLWAFAQLVTCISTNGQPVATHTSCSTCWSPSNMAGSWTSAWCAVLKVTPLRMDFMVSGFSQVVTWISTSVTVLSHPFWYSNLKLNHARAPTHWWPVAPRFSVDIMYVSGLLSVHTMNDW